MMSTSIDSADEFISFITAGLTTTSMVPLHQRTLHPRPREESVDWTRLAAAGRCLLTRISTADASFARLVWRREMRIRRVGACEPSL